VKSRPRLRQDDADAGARSQILALENIWNQAVTQHDMKALAEIFDDAYVYVDAEGLLMTKTDFLADEEGPRAARGDRINDRTNIRNHGHCDRHLPVDRNA
jgi:hypothetical protein